MLSTHAAPATRTCRQTTSISSHTASSCKHWHPHHAPTLPCAVPWAQVARCSRDEDLCADCQPEFTHSFILQALTHPSPHRLAARMQVARCFRDEDLRADRQPEFTQLDLEVSFMDAQAIQDLMEGLIVKVFREVAGVELQTPFPRMTYQEAMERCVTGTRGRDNLKPLVPRLQATLEHPYII